jgi:hypothetical protein
MAPFSHGERLAPCVPGANGCGAGVSDCLACDEDDIAVLSNAGVAGPPDFGIAGDVGMN